MQLFLNVLALLSGSQKGKKEKTEEVGKGSSSLKPL